MTDAELDALDAKLTSQIGDDVSVIFNHEALFKQSRAAITTIRAQLAAETARANRAEAERAAQIEADAGICDERHGSIWDYDAYECALAIRAQTHSRTALDAAIRAAKVEAWKEAAELMELAAANCRKQYTYPPKTKEQRDYMTGAIVHGNAAAAILALIGDATP